MSFLGRCLFSIRKHIFGFPNIQVSQGAWMSVVFVCAYCVVYRQGSHILPFLPREFPTIVSMSFVLFWQFCTGVCEKSLFFWFRSFFLFSAKRSSLPSIESAADSFFSIPPSNSTFHDSCLINSFRIRQGVQQPHRHLHTSIQNPFPFSYQPISFPTPPNKSVTLATSCLTKHRSWVHTRSSARLTSTSTRLHPSIRPEQHLNGSTDEYTTPSPSLLIHRDLLNSTKSVYQGELQFTTPWYASTRSKR